MLTERIPDFDSYYNRRNQEIAPKVDRNKVISAIAQIEDIMTQGHQTETEKSLILDVIRDLNVEEKYWVAEPFLREARGWALEAELAEEDNFGDLLQMEPGIRNPQAEKSFAVGGVAANINNMLALRVSLIGETVYQQVVRDLGREHPHRVAVVEAIQSWM